MALALTRASGGALSRAVPAAACLASLADSAPALTGALTGAITGYAALPERWRESSGLLAGCCLPDLAGTDIVAIADDIARTHGRKVMTPLEDKAVGAIAGAAVGDALGGATEGWTPEQIRARYDGWVTGIVPPYFADWRNARPIAPYHKGDGHVTDDTLMTHALVRVYERAGGHLDAYAAADHLVPEMMGEKRWIPELEAEALPLQRVFLAEKWLVLRLHYGHVDPREAGVGNIVNCGAAMYMAPVGDRQRGRPRRGVRRGGRPGGGAPVQLRPGGGGRASPPRSPRRCGPARPRTPSSPTACGSPRTARGPRSRRSANAPATSAHWDGSFAGAAGGGPPVRHGRRHLPRPGPGRAAAEPRCTASRSCRSRWRSC